MENESSRTIRVGDLAGGDRVRFPGGPDGPDAVYTINKIQKPGHGDCYVEIGYPDGGRYRTAMHENEKAELVARGGAVNTLEAAIRRLFERPEPGTVLEHGEHALYCAPGYPGVFVSFEDTEAGAALCYELVLAQLRFDWDGQVRRFHVLPDEA
jgi:hypothetical protein